MFVDRRQELSFLNSILERKHPTPAQFILVYGRRRVGKTRLLLHWAASSGLTFSYYPADKGPAVLQRKEFFARVVGGDSSESPAFESWTSCWQAIARFLADRRHILIIDEFPYLLAADPAASSALQHAWDHLFRESQLVIVLSGSHVHTMEHLQKADSPLFGRFTGQWHLEPLPFAALREFFPSWSAAERVAGYAITGGIPAYLEWLNPELSLVKNIRQVILRPGSRFVGEPTLLLYDEIAEASTHLAIVKAIGAGAHKLGEISGAAVVARNHLPTYLKRLRELRLVARRLAVTIPPAKRRLAKTSRYHLADPFFRFYFRYVHKYRDELALRQEQLIPAIQDNLRSFVGETAFEELCRQWVVEQAGAGEFPFVVQEVGSHWSRGVQVDVVAVNWPERKILLGDCKWGERVVGRNVVRDLIESKTPKVLVQLPNKGAGWQVHGAFFARTRFTDAARAEAESVGAMLVDLERLDADLGRLEGSM
jgi:AAA+ ATPase superfamily predicted ATPase